MKFSTAFTSLVAVTSAVNTLAFAPASSNARSSTSLAAQTLPPAMEWKSYYTKFDDDAVMMTGADKNFDPLGLSETATLFAMREAEIKHCRLAMYVLASRLQPQLFPFYDIMFNENNI